MSIFNCTQKVQSKRLVKHRWYDVDSSWIAEVKNDLEWNVNSYLSYFLPSKTICSRSILQRFIDNIFVLFFHVYLLIWCISLIIKNEVHYVLSTMQCL